jgi:hypothetical protein
MLHSFWKAEGEKFGFYNFMEATAQPIWDFTGVERDILRGITIFWFYVYSYSVILTRSKIRGQHLR